MTTTKKPTRFIGMHTKCAAVDIRDGYTLVCAKSYGHDHPEASERNRRHFDPDMDEYWESPVRRKRKTT